MKPLKLFLVVGGGGGLHYGKRTENPYDDFFTRDGRFFHYLRCTIEADSLRVETISVSPDSDQTKNAHTFTVSIP